MGNIITSVSNASNYVVNGGFPVFRYWLLEVLGFSQNCNSRCLVVYPPECPG